MPIEEIMVDQIIINEPIIVPDLKLEEATTEATKEATAEAEAIVE